ncbi:ATP-binding protein [Rhizobacter sp. SG703]|uniref:ATP-binding protein n=1 Tax=Rhizobacter sp. SG703 TaxID=2587140 RepID=UPI001444A3A0|nr:ATP-binding protein [Rhizobacter sp. SG703]NKI92532.1 signal transduction histidine kinase [Rhizobacter sp. SG703]
MKRPSVQALRQRFDGMQLSLRSTLLLVLLLAAVPIAALMSWQILDELRSDEARRQARLAAASTALSKAVERELESSIDALNILAVSDSLRGGDMGAFARGLAAAGRLRAGWQGAFVADADGTLRLDTATPGRRDRLRLPDLQRVGPGLGAVVSDLVTEPGSRQYATAVMVPLPAMRPDPSGRDAPPRVLGVWIPLRTWQSLIEHAVPLDAGISTLCDGQGRAIARTEAPERFVASPMCRGAVEPAVMRLPQPELGDAYVAQQQVAGSGWRVMVSNAAMPLEQAQRAAVATALATVGACLLLGWSVALLMARRITRPLQRLAAGLDATPSHGPQVREIEALGEAMRQARERDSAARAELERRAEEFETLFTCTPVGLAFAHDVDCRVVTHNAAMDRLFGPSPQAGSNGDDGWQMLRDGRPLPRCDWPLCVAARTGEPVETAELEVQLPGRPRQRVLASAMPLRDDDGRPRGAIGALVDISDQVRAKNELLQSNGRLRESQRLVELAQEVGQVGFFEYHVAQDLLTWTPGQARLLGRDGQALAGTLAELLDLAEPDDRRDMELVLLRAFAARRASENLEYRIALPDGRERWISTRVAISYGDDGRPCQLLGVSIDVSDRRRAERATVALMAHEQQAREKAEAVNRAKDELLAMLGHELRNPLGAISSAAEVLASRPPPALVASACEIIARQTRHLTRLMAEMLDTTRLMSGQMALVRQVCELAPLVHSALAPLQAGAAASGHALALALDEAWAEVDPLRIEQAISQLVGNALKYTPAGTTVRIRLERDGGEAVLQVGDDGPGIAPDLLPRIFDLFAQGERRSDRRDGGLGLGLTVAKRLVELHGGTIGVDSGADGTCFEIRLRGVAAPATSQAPAWRPPVAPRRVLVIEDNADALAALHGLLSVDGHEVLSESDGGAGLAAVLTQRPDLVIVDIGLPTLDGLQIARHARASGYPGRMVALTGYGREDDVRRSLKAGFDAHLVKPVHGEQLRRQLNEV